MKTTSFENISLEAKSGALIDIDDTLYNYKVAHNKTIQYCYNEFQEQFNLGLSFEEFNHLYRQERTEVTKRLSPQGPCRSRLFAFQAFFEKQGLKQNYVYALHFEKLYWSTLIDSISVAPKALNFLKRCQRSNVAVCAVSDMQAHFQIEKLQKMQLEPYIQFLVTSEETGEEKPSSKMFELAINKLNLPPSKVIMVGDSYEKDIIGAQNHGIEAYLVKLDD